MELSRGLDLIATEPVMTLATIDREGRPRLVPAVFALTEDGRIVTAVDHKPKRTRSLARLSDLARHPGVSVLVHHYEPDWTRLWWVRIEGTGAVLDRAADAIASRLIDRHPQYREHPPEGPWIVITPTRLTGWEANPPAGAS